MPRRGCIVTFTNLFPSAIFPTHGLFVRERMRRVAAACGHDWVVVSPVPRVPRPLRRGDHAAWAAMPAEEEVDGVAVHHPRYHHLPGLSTRWQARRMARGALEVVRRLVAAAGGRAALDAHYVYPDGVAALCLGERLAVPVVVTARGTDLNVLGDVAAVRRQIRRLAPRARARLAVSEPLRQRFAGVAGLPSEAVELVRNGVDLDRFAPGDPLAARAALDLPREGPLLLGVGRLTPGKGFHLAVRALRALPGARLVLVGAGPERERLVAAAPEGCLILLGPQPPDRVALAYRACDVLVLPSAREGWPNVVTEALASGLPVVASAVGSVPEMLSVPAAGAAVPPGDAAALGAAVAAILADPPPRSEVRAHAQRFSWDAPVQRLAALFDEVLA